VVARDRKSDTPVAAAARAAGPLTVDIEGFLKA
jgi:hypothetical protein